MRRIGLIALMVAAVAVLQVAGVAAGGSDDGYQVRAIFDNGAFLVEGEDVRIAGATVGKVDAVDVTDAEEAAREDGSPEPGKAVVVIQIDDPGFQDFRTDASCLIRPQSLLGEKYVDCQTTRPRAAGEPPPPELEVIGDDEPGAGQRFLPLENNGKSIDLDLVNNIMREPYVDRLRLILNDLGAGLAGRGEELASIVERANPALKETDRVLAILARQNRTLGKLASDGARIMGPLARDRRHLSGFINNADTTAVATAERNPELEAGLQRLPAFLRELRGTMSELRGFSDAATPTVADLGDAAPALTRATEALGPFSAAGIPALTTLGDAAEESGPDLVASNPLINDLRKLGDATKPSGKNLARLLGSLERTGGYKRILEFLFYSVGATNGYDEFGHYLRAVLVPNSCTHYSEVPTTAACGAHFEGDTPIGQAGPTAAVQTEDDSSRSGLRRTLEAIADAAADGDAEEGTAAVTPSEPSPDDQADDAELPSGPEAGLDRSGASQPKAGRSRSMREMQTLLKYFLGSDR